MKKKNFDCVATMRKIRVELGKKYSNRDIEEKDLAIIRKKYGIHLSR